MPPKQTTTTNVEESTIELPSVGGVSPDRTGNVSTVEEDRKDYKRIIELSPLEIEKKKAYESEIRKNNAKTLFWQVLMYAIPAFLTIVGIIVAIYTGIFTYYLKEVSQPIGSMQSQFNNINENINRIDQDIRDIRNMKNNSTN